MIKKIINLILTLLILTQLNTVLGQTTITMQKEGGVYVVPCTVNGLKLKFIFDTGASSVTISLTEAIFMVKNDYLQEKDILGISYAQLANGDITENTRIILREIEFAGLKLYNVEALVVHQLSAPLLLGQSAISQLGTFQLNPQNNTLTILKGSKTSYNFAGNSTYKTETIKDIDGNIYNTVTIGTQVWMMENLKVTKYRYGDAIPTTTAGFRGESTPKKYQWAYNADINNVATYGRLYTGYAVTDSRNVCPTGWHVPSDDEWTTLTDNLGRGSIAGGKMKEAGTSHWSSPNAGADNSSGFSALPGGYRNVDGLFGPYGGLGYNASFWSATEGDASNAWVRSLYGSGADLNRYNDNKHNGFSVRCVRD